MSESDFWGSHFSLYGITESEEVNRKRGSERRNDIQKYAIAIWLLEHNTKFIIYLKRSEKHFSYHISQTHEYEVKIYFYEYSDLY